MLGGIIQDRGTNGLWKLIVDENSMSGYTGPFYPNASTSKDAFSFNTIEACGSNGCLYRLDTDPSETLNLASTHSDIAEEMLRELIKLNTTSNLFSPDRGVGEAVPSIADAACRAALDDWDGFWGPFM